MPARLRSWALVVGVMAAMYAILAGIVKRGSNTISRQRRVLNGQVDALTQLLSENGRLSERVRHAAERTTLLNQQALRRISGDLHDGPGQALGLALLRLDALEESRLPTASGAEDDSDFDVVRSAVRDALEEIRSISAGLRLPALAPLGLSEVVERAVRDHRQRSGTAVAVDAGELPREAPLSLKVALFRALQESLSNASRHGGGKDLRVRVRYGDNRLTLDVADGGQGFFPNQVSEDGHLGLAGMREQAELLGGSFHVVSHPGAGTTVHVEWPFTQHDENEYA
jgi:signal transduction histidine kinase